MSVKACDNYEINIFERTFDYYAASSQDTCKIHNRKTTTITTSQPPANLPQIPPRKKERSPSPEKPDKVQIPVGIKTSESSQKFENARNNFHLNPKDFPIQLQDVEMLWRLLKQPVHVGWGY